MADTGLSYDEAVKAATAAGQAFATVPGTVDGIDQVMFEHCPPSLRALFDGARAHGERTFLVYEDERWSFSDVMASVDALAAALVDHYGVAKGDRVSIAMRNYPEWIVSFAAITSIGAVSVSMNAWWSEDEMSFALEDSGTKVLIADRERVQRSRIAASRLGISTIVVRTTEAATPETGVDRWEDVVEPGAAVLRRHAVADQPGFALLLVGQDVVLKIVALVYWRDVDKAKAAASLSGVW